jgi:hypothetical protein
MKKILFTFLFLGSALLAEAEFYIGVGYMYINESLSDNSSTKINNNGAKIKFGYGERKAYAVEFSLNYIDNNSALLSIDDKEKYGFDIELMKAWDFDIYALPFIRVGFGAGQMNSTARTGKNSISYGSFNGSLGTLLPLSESFDLEIAYEYKYISYQKTNATLSGYPKSHQNSVYTGINYRF